MRDIDFLHFQRLHEALCLCIIVRIGRGAHRNNLSKVFQCSVIQRISTLATSIRVVDARLRFRLSCRMRWV